jgi:hypothetical protein
MVQGGFSNMAQQQSIPWGSPGLTEQLEIQETAVYMPGAAGGQVARTVQRAGFLKRLRMYAQAHFNVSAYTGAPGKSALGPLGSYLSAINVKANGQTDLVSLTGLGAMIYNEIQNRDGSILSHPVTLTTPAHNVPAAADLVAYDAIGATGDFYAKYPFEFQFALPFYMQGMVSELGLWLLQNQAIDVALNVTFNPLYQASANVNALWSAGTLTGTPTLADCLVNVERELYAIPRDPGSYPPLAWAHQVIEYTVPIASNQAVFQIPRAGLLLRAIAINMDSNFAAVEYTDVSSMKYIYGANETPISRPGWSWTQEYLQDYGRQPQKGVLVLDFYKWGENGLKLVKNTEDISNLRIETNFTATATGTQKIILDRLIPVANR